MHLGWKEFEALRFEPNVADSVEPVPCLAVDLRGAPPEIDPALVDWIARQPIPIVGLDSNASGNRAAALMDIVVADPDMLEMVTTAIAANPRASAVLVQVLRASLALNISQALSMESLAYATLQGGEEFRRWLAAQPARTPKQPDGSPVLVERRDNHIDITLNHPANRNALSAPLRDGLADACRLVAVDASIETVEVRGNGPVFCAGGDLAEFGSVTDLSVAHETRMTRMPAQYIALAADRYTFRLHGACIGAGIEMPAFAKQLVATADTIFRLPEVAMGLIPGAGGCVSIPRRIGRQRTALMAVTGMDVTAETALAWGLIDAIG